MAGAQLEGWKCIFLSPSSSPLFISGEEKRDHSGKFRVWWCVVRILVPSLFFVLSLSLCCWSFLRHAQHKDAVSYLLCTLTFLRPLTYLQCCGFFSGHREPVQRPQGRAASPSRQGGAEAGPVPGVRGRHAHHTALLLHAGGTLAGVHMVRVK